MSSTGTRVVPTLTEVLDEQRLSKPVSNLSTEAWPSGRRGDEELVPISLDWGDEPAAIEAAGHHADAGGVMTPWQVVQPRSGSVLPDDTPFIDLSIDVAPVQPPALDAQVLDVFALPPSLAAEPVGNADPAWPAAELEATPPWAAEPGLSVPLAPAALLQPVGDDGVAEAAASASRATVAPTALAGEALEASALGAVEPVPPSPEFAPAPAPAVEPVQEAALPPSTAVPVEVPASVLNMLAAAGAAAAMAPTPPLPTSAGLPVAPATSQALDPGMHAVRQGGEHVPGISEERLQAILQQALDRLLRDELPSALVETLIRLSPQLSESLIESLKPSLHLHVMEALSAESLSSHEGRSKA